MLRLRYYATTVAKSHSRGRLRPPISLRQQQQINDHFQLHQIQYFQDFDFTLYKFAHLHSNLKYYHFDCDTLNNTFAILIRNHINDDSGVSCVLEKMLQCGSHKYKVKDTVQEMKNRSFNQANLVETNDDYSLFPFQTKCVKDFHNLLDVYLHMVYNPRLSRSDFEEVCGRLYLINNKPTEELEFVGKAFQETLTYEQILKYNLHSTLNQHLYNKPFRSFGRSSHMIKLKYQDLVRYHVQNYIPDNSVLYSHGDMNPVQHIHQITKAFSDMNLIRQPNRTVKFNTVPEPVLPKTVTIEHAQTDTFFMLSYRIGSAPIEDRIKLSILSYLMFDLPDSPLMKWIQLNKPYPPLYGFQDNLFNIGFMLDEPASEKDLVGLEKKVVEQLTQIVEVGFSDNFVEMCLNHLESNYYTADGLKLISNVAKHLLEGERLDCILNGRQFLNQIGREFKKQGTFENLTAKYILNNPNFLRVYGKPEKHFTQNLHESNKDQLKQLKQNLSKSEIEQIIYWQPTQELQDVNSLPIVSPLDYELFEQIDKQVQQIQDIKTTFLHHHTHPCVTIRFDISDLKDQEISLLSILCKVMPSIGYRSIKYDTFCSYYDKFINSADMWFDTAAVDGGMKIYLFLKVDFLYKNLELGISMLNGIMTKPDFNNLSRLSEIINEQSSHIYNNMVEQQVDFGISYVNSEMNTFSKIQDRLFHSRATTNLMIEMMKITNPKNILQNVANGLSAIHARMVKRSRMEILVKCQKDSNAMMAKYLTLILAPIDNGNQISYIDISNFTPKPLKTYFPNYSEPFVFESFAVPYQDKETPAVALLASCIDAYIKDMKIEGGCVTHKGCLTAFMRGDKSKFLELEKMYHDWNDLDAGKRRLFQAYDKHTPEEQFRYGVDADKVKFFKQAVLAATEADVRAVLSKYISNALKQQTSSMLIMGPRLDRYESMLKTGWTIERVLEETSLKMETESNKRLEFNPTKYLLIC